MEHSRLLFKIDTHSSLPINVQIKEQIKWLIGRDILKPGDSLPSTNQLAEQLAINRNTIQWVYSQLKEEGLLLIQKGRGTQVANEGSIENFKKNNPYFSFIEKTIKEVYDSGFNAEKVLLSGFAYIQLFSQPLAKRLRYLFIECRTISCVFYLDEIKRMTLAEIDVVDTSSPEEVLQKAIRQADVIVTVSELAEKVQEFVKPANKKIISVGSSNDVTLLFNMLRP
ncbi:DNA-binding transcriptional regulator YhcF, GntR family [Paenibacillus algorifonticola]|uniref:DNA-binding transcriptional regulator YhcF, GntR family n=1 Tax=Paenibacillus algorifonticola TaxID=684063 RepID=A0A1I2IVN3_9BACL|nr:GntR family transcriptional regulator [Paenibacillus algorifonticola]SFF45057.1 DNA-binding transcriptional regulator YhcF, GntR family [Paenibacillus algorifonticola]